MGIVERPLALRESPNYVHIINYFNIRHIQTWTKPFFGELFNLELHICRKKRVNYDKFEISKNSVNQIFNPHVFLVFLLIGAT